LSFEETESAFIWTCEGCGKIAAFPSSDFYGRKDELKERGWLFSLEEETGHEGWGRTWHHYCQKCRRERQQPNWMDRTYSKPREVKGSG
jgi:hypothetical protein